MREKNDKKLYSYLITIAYDGSDFAGWATQPNEFTTQGCIETILSKVFQKKYRWEYNLPLEVKKLNHILQIFQGKHNFFNYSYCRWQERERVNTEREIISLKSWKRKNVIVISIIAKGFLRYQIRAIIGEVINCYEGKQSIKNLQDKLVNFGKKNYKYKNIAPASGLYLWKIDYENRQ